MPFAQLDLAFRATRPVAAGEELFFDYGEDWAAQWAAYKDKVRGRRFDQAVPRFRAFIGAPDGLFVDHWLDE